MMCITTGVELDRGDLEFRGARDALPVGVDEEAGPDPGVLEPGKCGRQWPVHPSERESSFRGHLFSALGNEGGLVGTDPAGEIDDVGAGGELEIERGGGHRRDRDDIAVLDVAAVLAKMESEAIRAPVFCGAGG